MTWIQHHSKSEEFAAEAEVFARAGDGDSAKAMYRHAAEAEVAALKDVDPSKSRTVAITAISAVALWYKGEEYTQAEQLAYQILSTSRLPHFGVMQLRGLLQTIWGEQALQRAGVKPSRSEVLTALNYGRAVNLKGRNLAGLDLSGADLTEANLSGADLTKADLTDATLIRTNLSGANLTEARIGRTFFDDTDLRPAHGLETCVHLGPSSIGIKAITKSHGVIPEIFLRGVGVPDTFITSVKALVSDMNPIQFYSCFISYASGDQKFAERLYEDLRAMNVRCWFAPEDLKIGDKFRSRIDESIRVFDKMLVVLSEHSVASPWVEEEIESALQRERRDDRTVLFPIRLDDAVFEVTTTWAAHIRRTRQIGDFRTWKGHNEYEIAFQRLLRDLKSEATPPTEDKGAGRPVQG